MHFYLHCLLLEHLNQANIERNTRVEVLLIFPALNICTFPCEVRYHSIVVNARYFHLTIYKFPYQRPNMEQIATNVLFRR